MLAKRKLIFGLGSGRCGTTSLTFLFDRQFSTTAMHEYFVRANYNLPFEHPDEDKVKQYLLEWLQYNTPVLVDVGFYWLNYVHVVMSFTDNASFVCLKRKKQRTVDSFLKNKSEALFFQEKNEEELEAYYDWYYEKAENFEGLYPKNFKVFDIDCLNSVKGQSDMLAFCGYERKDIVYVESLDLNNHSDKRAEKGIIHG